MSILTESEANDLLQWGVSLAQNDQSEWEPRCVAEAFSRSGLEFVLTMQGWIDLDAIRSPILQGNLPEADDAPEQLIAAMAAFNRVPDVECTPENAIEIGHRMIEAVRLAFSTMIKMQPPNGFSTASPASDFGLWLPVLSALVGLLHDVDKALALPVQQAFALLAGTKSINGWTVMGETYRTMEVSEPDGRSKPDQGGANG